MKWALVNFNGIVQNVINYDGTAPYTPPGGTTLQQINDWVDLGQAASTPKPVVSPPVTPS